MFIDCPYCQNVIDTYDPLYYDELTEGIITCEHCGKKVHISEDDKTFAEIEILDILDNEFK